VNIYRTPWAALGDNCRGRSQIILFNHSKFGKSSEKYLHQAELFEGAEQKAGAPLTAVGVED
jgi:hypothetical protein